MIFAPIKAVVFDFYFTLVDPNVHAHESIADLLQRHGSARSPQDAMATWAALAHRRPDVDDRTESAAFGAPLGV